MEQKYKIAVEYDGTNYFGWQVQNNGPTIQGQLQKALLKIFKTKVKLLGSGRTDRGVHAEGQVAHFVAPWKIPPQNLLMALNTNLPWDISVMDIEEVEMDFHAIASAVSKRYRYTILNQRCRSAIWSRSAAWVVLPLDVEHMKEAAVHLVGKNDFSSFESSHSPRRSSVRTITHLAVEQRQVGRNNLIHILVQADGFLYNMVRTISGTLMEVGRGKIQPSQVRDILEAKDRRKAGPTAEARGLCLVQVNY